MSDEKDLTEAIELLEALDRLSKAGRGFTNLEGARKRAVARVAALLKDYAGEKQPTGFKPL